MYIYMTFYLMNDMLTTGLLASGSSKMFSSSGISKKISKLEKKNEEAAEKESDREILNITRDKFKTNLHTHQWHT